MQGRLAIYYSPGWGASGACKQSRSVRTICFWPNGTRNLTSPRASVVNMPQFAVLTGTAWSSLYDQKRAQSRMMWFVHPESRMVLYELVMDAQDIGDSNGRRSDRVEKANDWGTPISHQSRWISLLTGAAAVHACWWVVYAAKGIEVASSVGSAASVVPPPSGLSSTSTVAMCACAVLLLSAACCPSSVCQHSKTRCPARLQFVQYLAEQEGREVVEAGTAAWEDVAGAVVSVEDEAWDVDVAFGCGWDWTACGQVR